MKDESYDEESLGEKSYELLHCITDMTTVNNIQWLDRIQNCLVIWRWYCQNTISKQYQDEVSCDLWQCNQWFFWSVRRECI